MKSIRSICLLLQLSASIDIFAAFENYWCDAQTGGRANSGIAVQSGAQGLLSNPAATVNPEKFDFLSTCANPFNVGIKYINVAAVMKLPKCWIGCAGQKLGNEKYGESSISLNGAFNMMHNVVFGATVHWCYIDIINYGAASAFMADVGTLVRLNELVEWGSCVQNITNSTIGADREELPHVLTTGFGLHPHRCVSISLDIVKDERYPADLRCGLEFNPVRKFFLRTGFGSEPACFSAGFSLMMSCVEIHYAFYSHGELNPTLIFSLGIHIR